MAHKTIVYVSNADDGSIGIYEIGRDGGALRAIGTVEAGAKVMPLAVSPDRRHLYASIRSQPYRVATYAIDAATGGLTLEGTAPLAESMCCITTDATGRYLLSASYGGSIASVNPIGADGVITAGAAQTVTTGKHAHAIILDRTNSSAYVPCLGSDEVMQYGFDAGSGKLTALERASAPVAAGYGPRHMRLSPDNRFAYVLCELTGHVLQFERQASGALIFIESVPSVPPEARLVPGRPRGPGSSAANDLVPCVWCADIQMTPNGRFLYTTERTTSTIALLHVAPVGGSLTYVDAFATEQQPRGIRIDPAGRFLVASGERSDHIIVFSIDQTNGTLSPIGRCPAGKGSNWVEIVELTS